MDFEKLDKIVEKFIIKNKFHVDTLPVVSNYSKQVLDDEMQVSSDNYSRKFELRESINIVLDFIRTLDENMAMQFLNILNSKDEKGNPYINILSKKEHPDGLDEVKEGKVFIYYSNTVDDPFIIFHEMLHKMNECNIMDEENNQIETFTRDYFGETVSILGEKMLGNYMLENGLISKNDLDIREKERLSSSKENARDVIVEDALIKLKLSGKKINYDNLINMFNSCDKNSKEFEVLNDEKNDLRRINSILSKNNLNLVKSQRYVIAQVLSKELLKKDSLEEDFIKLHYAVGDANSSINDVYAEIISTVQNTM